MNTPSIDISVQTSAIRLLGMAAPPVHPAELLGLEMDDASWDAATVSRSLLDRLRRIDEHPQCRTPEADELRVALHVAAAQLRDPGVRSNLRASEHPADLSESEVQRDPLVAPGATEVGLAPPPVGVTVSAGQGGDAEFRVAAEHVLASCGGWNVESKRRLGYLARSASVDASVLQQTLVAITRQHEQPVRASASGAQVSAGNTPDEPSAASPLSRGPAISKRPLDHRISSSRARTWLTIGTAIMLVSSLVIGMGLLTLIAQELFAPQREIQTRVIQGTSGSVQPSQLPGSSTPAPVPDPADAPVTAPAPPIVSDGRTLVRYLQSLTTDSFADAPKDSLAGFTSVYQQFAANWVGFDPEILAAAPLAIRDAILAAAESEDSLAIRAMEPLLIDLEPLDPQSRSLDPLALTRSVFAYGTLTLLEGTPIPPGSERNLRTRLNSIASLIDGGAGGARDFEHRSEVALRVLASKLIPGASEQNEQSLEVAWSAWIKMVQRYEPVDSTNLMLDAIEGITAGVQSPSSHRTAAEIIKSLVREIDWLGDPGRMASSRLMVWFDNPEGIPDGVLSLITGEFVDRSLLPGLDASMKLSSGGSSQDRRTLRDQYALRLSHPLIGEGLQFAREWAGYAEELLDQGLPSDHLGALDRAVRAARLNEAAALWIASEDEAARAAMLQARIGLEELAAGARGPVSFGRGSTPRADGEWAKQYLLARRNADERSRLLYELENTGGPAGEADADVLAEAASYSTPMEVRRQAQSIVMTYAEREWVLLGLLEVLPRAAAQQNVSDMLSTVTGRTLPPVDDQSWRTEARKALVARLLELMVDPDQKYVEVAGEVLERSLRTRADLLPAVDRTVWSTGLEAIERSMQTSQAGPAGPTESATDYADRLTEVAGRYPQRATLFATLPEIESRRVWRLRLVNSDTGSFAAELTSVLELTAYIYGSERSGDAEVVNGIIMESAAARRAANSVYEQIAINELAMLRIHLRRLRGGA